MSTMTYAFEPQIGAAARSARRRTHMYDGERSRTDKKMLAFFYRAARQEAKPMHAPELLSRFGAKTGVPAKLCFVGWKSSLQGRALLVLEGSGA